MVEESTVLSELYEIITPNKRELFDRVAAERTQFMTVVLENVYQEHNASAVLRSCDCFGIQTLHVIEKDNQYKVQRDIALGAGRWVDLYNFNRGENPSLDCIRALKDKGYKILATTPHERDVSVNDVAIDQPFALVFGTERRGISPEIMALADEYVHIPMYGFTESFNISVSVAIVLNVLRERLEKSSIQWKLTPEEQVSLKLKWSKKILRGGDALAAEIIRRIEASEEK